MVLKCCPDIRELFLIVNELQNTFFRKKILTSKNGLQTPFLALEGLKLRKSGILRGHNPNFLAKRERSIASPVWEKRGHNYPKSLYRTDF